MSKEADSKPGGEPVLSAGAAGLLLLMSGRAVERGGCLVMTDVKPDSIGRAALAIHEGEIKGTLSEAIEELTGAPSTVHPEVLTRLVVPSMVEQAVQLGMPRGEATAQIPV